MEILERAGFRYEYIRDLSGENFLQAKMRARNNTIQRTETRYSFLFSCLSSSSSSSSFLLPPPPSPLFSIPQPIAQLEGISFLGRDGGTIEAIGEELHRTNKPVFYWKLHTG